MAHYPPSFTVYINSTSAIHAANLSISMIHKSWPGGRSSLFLFYIYSHTNAQDIVLPCGPSPSANFLHLSRVRFGLQAQGSLSCNVDQETWIQWGPTPIAGLWAASFFIYTFLPLYFRLQRHRILEEQPWPSRKQLEDRRVRREGGV